MGSCREIIEGFEGDSVVGRGGFVVEPCNPKATAQALAAILLDHAMRAEMGRVMLQRIPNLYHKDRIRRLYEELYDSLAHAPKAAPECIDAREADLPKARSWTRWPAWSGRHRPVRYA